MLKETIMNKKKAKLIAQIIKCKEEIDSLKANINKDDAILALFNKKIMEKAVLSQQLKDFDDNFMLKLVKNVIPKKEKIISDYFS